MSCVAALQLVRASFVVLLFCTHVICKMSLVLVAFVLHGFEICGFHLIVLLDELIKESGGEPYAFGNDPLFGNAHMSGNHSADALRWY